MTTTLTTMEELEALQPDSKILVRSNIAGNQIWAKVANNRMQSEQNNATIAIGNFIGAIRGGMVDLVAVPEPVPEGRLTVNGLSSELVADLHHHAERMDDPDFDDMLERHGVGRATEHTTIITITGVTYYSPDMSLIREFAGLGPDFTLTEPPVAPVHWSRTVRLTKRGMGCTCEDFDGESLEQYLPSVWADWEYEHHCAPDHVES